MTDEELRQLMRERPPIGFLDEFGEVCGYGFDLVLPEERLSSRDFDRLGDRWIVIADDLEEARGPSCADRTFGNLLSKASVCVLDWGHLHPREYLSYAKAALMGARVVVVRTEESQRHHWAMFLDLHATSSSQTRVQQILNADNV
jgi:hypothetical protein